MLQGSIYCPYFSSPSQIKTDKVNIQRPVVSQEYCRSWFLNCFSLFILPFGLQDISREHDDFKTGCTTIIYSSGERYADSNFMKSGREARWDCNGISSDVHFVVQHKRRSQQSRRCFSRAIGLQPRMGRLCLLNSLRQCSLCLWSSIHEYIRP